MKKLFTLFAAALFATNISAQQMTPLVQNGDLSDENNLLNYRSKEAPSTDIVNGTVVEEDGLKCIKVVAPAQVSNPWDTQFWIEFDESVDAGTKLHVHFQYKADAEVSGVHPQAHYTPGNYNGECASQMGGDLTATTSWQTCDAEFEVTAGMCGSNGFKSIAFNLAFDADHIFYFGDFLVEGKIVKLAEPEWINILVNGNCEEEYDACIYPTSVTDGEEGVYSLTANGTGLNSAIVDGAFVIESKPDAANPWDTQFFIVAPRPLEANSRVMVAYEYRADAEAPVTTQTHRKPGDYLGGGWTGWQAVTVGTEWQSVQSDVITVGQDCQAFVFNLNEDKTLQTKFYFDNVQLFFDDGESGYTTSDDEDLADEIAEKWATGVKTLKTQKTQAAIYNLAGQQVDKNYKGIVIENGQKRINK